MIAVPGYVYMLNVKFQGPLPIRHGNMVQPLKKQAFHAIAQTVKLSTVND